MVGMVVFEAPDQTAAAIVKKYQESFIDNDDDFSQEWFIEAENNPAMLEEFSSYQRDDFKLLAKLSKAVVDGKIPEGAAEWLFYQVLPVDLFGTYSCTQSPPADRQNLIWPEDQPRALETFNWYMSNRKDSVVQNRMREKFPGRNVKNPLEYTIWELEELQSSLTPESEAEERNERWMPLEMGFKESQATVSYNKGEIMIVEVTDKNAASKYAAGTRWCTSSPATAQTYLNKGPLYVVFRNGKKYGQIHSESDQIMDLQDRPIGGNLPPEIATFMVKTDRDKLINLLEKWPTRDDLAKSFQKDEIARKKRELMGYTSQLAKAQAVYEGNDVDEESYSRFFLSRLYGMVDTTTIQRVVDSATEELLEIEDPDYITNIPQFRIDQLNNGNIDTVTNLLKGLENMISKVSPSELNNTQLLTPGQFTILENKLEESGSNINFLGTAPLLLATLPMSDQRKGKLVSEFSADLGSAWRVGNNADTIMRIVKIQTGKYDLEAFSPELQKMFLDNHAAMDMFPSLQDNLELEKVLAGKGAVQLIRPRVMWWLSQPETFQNTTIESMSGLDLLQKTSGTVDENASFALHLPGNLPRMVITKIAKEVVTGELTDDTIVANYHTREWQNQANIRQALVERAKLVDATFGDEIETILTSTVVDFSIINRSKMFLMNNGIEQYSSGKPAPALVTTSPLFTPKTYKKIAKGLLTELEWSAEFTNVVISRSQGYSSNRISEFATSSFTLPDGELISSAFPIVNPSEGGDAYGDLRESVLEGLTDPAIGLSPNSSGSIADYLHLYVEPLIDSNKERRIKQINSKGLIRPPAVVGWGCPCCYLPIEYDSETNVWSAPEDAIKNDTEFGVRWDWNRVYVASDAKMAAMKEVWPNSIIASNDATLTDRNRQAVIFRVLDDEFIPHSCPAMDLVDKKIIISNNGYRNLKQKQVELDLVKPGLRPHLLIPSPASALWCTKCFGWRAISQEVRNSYNSQTTQWEQLRSVRPCKCGYTKASFKLYEAESFEDYDPSESEITEEILGGLGDGGPIGLGAESFEAEYTRISAGDMDTFLIDLGFVEEPRVPRRERQYVKLYGRGPGGAELMTRVYSSIIDSLGAARDSGKDAIRVVPIYRHPTYGDFALGKNKRVHRVNGWRRNLTNRIEESEQSAPGPVLDSRGKPMRLRQNRKTKQYFWGSLDYPKNLETKPYRG